MLDTIMKELELLGTAQTKKIYLNYGVKEPFFGVRVGDMNKLIKKYKLKNNHELAQSLFDTGNYDAMYLAGLIEDSQKTTKEQIYQWMEKAYCHMIGEYIVAPVTSETAFSLVVARDFIGSEDEIFQSTGYYIFNFYVALAQDDEIDKDELRAMLAFIEKHIHQSKNRVRYAMNSFVASVGVSVPELTELAYSVAESIGKVSVDVGNTACKVPSATLTIKKAKDMGRIGFKRKTSRC